MIRTVSVLSSVNVLTFSFVIFFWNNPMNNWRSISFAQTIIALSSQLSTEFKDIRAYVSDTQMTHNGAIIN